MRVLIAEDDAAISAGLKLAMVDCGYAVDQVTDGEAADRALRNQVYEVLVLDLGLPNLDGVEIVRRARSRGDTTSILVVTAREGVTDRVQLLDLGADDYLVKPHASRPCLRRLWHVRIGLSHARNWLRPSVIGSRN